MKSMIAPLLILCAAPLTALAQEEGEGGGSDRFYLSTDRVFAPGQPVAVKLEARGIPSLELRLYRVPDPKAYFDAQADLHRPANEHQTPRQAALPMLHKGLRRGMSSWLDRLRNSFGRQGRAAIKATVPELHAGAFEAGAETQPEVVLPPLADVPLLDVWTLPLSSGGGWSYEEVEIPAYEPGAYLVEATSGDQAATTIVLITDVALVTKQSQSQLLVWAVDPASGDPRSEVAITVLERGAVLAEKKSGADGLARFDLGLKESTVLYGRHGDSFTLLDPRYYPANLPEPRVYLFTERPVYRPGQEVFFKGFARDVAEERYRLPKPESREVQLEVLDPKGESWTTLTADLSERGAFDGRFELPEEPAMGTWQLVAEIDGRRHSGQFKVMAFVKPEVRLEVRLDQAAVRSGDKLSGDVVGSYFFGAPYPGAAVKIAVSRTRFFVPWWVDADYAWYYSESEYRNTAREVIEEISCNLDARGECPFEVVTKEGSEDYTYVVEATALDPTGKTISGSAQAPVTEGAFRLSFLPGPLIVAPGSKTAVKVQARDYSGRPVNTSIDVLVGGQRMKGDQVEKVEVLRRTLTTDAQGIASFEVDAARGGYYQLQASAKDDRGVAIEAEGFLFASDGGGDLPLAPEELEIITDKKSYFAGETALVLVLAPSPAAKVLFSVEGGELYRAEVLTAKGHAALVKVEIGERQTPNFFLSAVTVAGGQTFTRQRSVVVPPREKLLTVEVAPDRPEAQPGEKITFTVSVTNYAGKPVPGAEVALAVVDEAIYAISPEIAVPLEGFFHPRKRNDVRTQESVSFRFFGSSQPLDGTAARLGGEAFRYGSLKPQVQDVRKVFKDTAGWFPSLVTGDRGTVSAEVTLPDNLTAWRATARAITDAAAVGMSTASVKAKKPLMVQVAVPPQLIEGDRGRGALILQNFSGKNQTIDTELTPADPASFDLRAAGGAALPGKIELADGQTLRVPFEYRALKPGPLALTAKAGGQGASDALEARIQIGEWSRVRRFTASGRTSAEAPTIEHPLELPEGSKLEEAKLEVELVASPLAAIRASLPYLLEYPYGCTEQTMSRFVPLVVAKAAFDKLGLTPPPEAAQIPKMLAAGTARLRQLQHPDGGWGWWERDASDPWMTAWVLEGLAEAKAQGASIDPALIDGGARALEAMLRQQKTPEERAFALWALARANKAMPAMVESLGKEAAALPASALAHLALAARAGGQGPLADQAIAALIARGQRGGGLASWGDSAQAATDQPLEATSLAVLALAEAGPAHAAWTADGAAWLLAQYGEERFGTTRQTALSLRALVKTLEKSPPGEATLVVKAGGGVVLEEKFDAKRAGDAAIRARPKLALTDRTLEVEVEQKGPGTFFHTVALVAPVRSQDLPPVSSGGLSIERTYLSLSGSAGAYSAGGPVKRAAPGDTVLVRLALTAASSVEFLMVEDPRPAGLSAVTGDSGVQVSGVDLIFEGLHREHRDDRTAFFLRRLSPGKTELYYLARVGLEGSYRALPARAESMYLPNRFHAQSASDRLEVGKK